MKKSFLKFAFLALLIPIGFISCKDNPRTDQERTATSDAMDKIDHAADKVAEKAHRLVGNYEEALEKAQERVRNAEEEIQKAINDNDAKAEERARESKRNAEQEIQELKEKIKEQERN